jgi:hypothetical protein
MNPARMCLESLDRRPGIRDAPPHGLGRARGIAEIEGRPLLARATLMTHLRHWAALKKVHDLT